MLNIFQCEQRSTYAAVVPPPIFVNRPASGSALRMRDRKLIQLTSDQLIILEQYIFNKQSNTNI